MASKKLIIPRSRGTRKTRRSVRLAEIVSRYLITTGGIGTIVAVVGVFLFLLYVAIPLFLAASITDQQRGAVDWTKSAPVQMGMDEDQLMCWGLFADGSLQLVRADTGQVLEKRSLFPDARLTAVSFTPGGEQSAFGFADGSVRMGTILFSSRFVKPEEAPSEARDLAKQGSVFSRTGTLIRTPQDQLRMVELAVDIKEPAKAARPSPVLLIDQSKTPSGQVIAVFTADGKLRLNSIREHKNLLTDETTFRLTPTELPYVEPPGKGQPFRLFMSALGDQVYLFWKDGHLIRFDVRDKARPVVAEVRNLLEDRAFGGQAGRVAHVTEVCCLIGKSTYLVGDSSGRVKAWFYTPTGTGGRLVCGHDLGGPDAPVTAVTVSERTRTAAVAYASGKIQLLQVTSERVVLEVDVGFDSPHLAAGAARMVLAPKDNGLAAVSGSGLFHWTFDPGHPEVSAKALFGKVWYEGYDQPEFVWQSTGGTDSFEPKFSLTPLVFGTLKASFYSLLFAVPLALLAAIYTSEFLHPRTKAVIKPAIELMASLPSVVLGFLAGLVFAQFIEGVVSSVLACLITVPLAFVTGAYLWQLLPDRIAQVLARWRFLFIAAVLPLGLLAAMALGPIMEDVLFDGNLRRWLDGGDGSAAGGWVLVLLPLCASACLLLMARVVNPWLRTRTAGLGRFATALIDLAKFLAGCVFTCALAWALGLCLGGLGLDARGVFMGPYSQRNAMVVGLIVAFAIIPIIYTIAEDALSSVPEHLRAGSLATGATRWQTAMRIVIPTAMSGLFSAVMIGMGRAVGETMIMLMATGNTPVMDWSIFSGFRTLSANIAVELPEAAVNTTHFRVLFLAALTLFAITFALNTVAEIVRLRFRRRAYQL